MTVPDQSQLSQQREATDFAIKCAGPAHVQIALRAIVAELRGVQSNHPAVPDSSPPAESGPGPSVALTREDVEAYIAMIDPGDYSADTLAAFGRKALATLEERDLAWEQKVAAEGHYAEVIDVNAELRRALQARPFAIYGHRPNAEWFANIGVTDRDWDVAQAYLYGAGNSIVSALAALFAYERKRDLAAQRLTITKLRDALQALLSAQMYEDDTEQSREAIDDARAALAATANGRSSDG